GSEQVTPRSEKAAAHLGSAASVSPSQSLSTLSWQLPAAVLSGIGEPALASHCVPVPSALHTTTPSAIHAPVPEVQGCPRPGKPSSICPSPLSSIPLHSSGLARLAQAGSARSLRPLQASSIRLE